MGGGDACLGSCRYVRCAHSRALYGAHLNPAVTLGLAAAGKFPWEYVLPYIVS